MREHAERQATERKRAGHSWHESGHVFRMQAGTPLFPDIAGEPSAGRSGAPNSAHPETPLPHMRLHDLRHIHATLLLKPGVPVHVVAARLGHADLAITLRVYAQVLRDQASEAAQVFASAVEEGYPEDPWC